MRERNPAVHLHKGKERSIQLKHPWVFSGAIKSADSGIREGGIVDVYSHAGEFLASGHYHDGSIKVRIITFQKTDLDFAFWTKRLQEAFSLRSRLGLTSDAETDCYRLVHGEADGMPGLIIDIYGAAAVLQAHTAGMYAHLSEIAEALAAIYGDRLTTIYDKSAETVGRNKASVVENRFLRGSQEEFRVKERGILFDVNLVEGQKTGFFLDQRDNRSLLKSYSKGQSVLNTFCYSGGFSLSALSGGASSVVSVDSSSKAIKLAQTNTEINGFKDHELVTDDVFNFLKKDDRMYDIVILDPPAFAKHLSSLDNATVGYRNLNTIGFKKVNKGGLLFTYSCSQVVDKQLFRKIVFQAAAQSGRNVRILHQLGQAPDHPISIYHPEGEYLKGLVLFVD